MTRAFPKSYSINLVCSVEIWNHPDAPGPSYMQGSDPHMEGSCSPQIPMVLRDPRAVSSVWAHLKSKELLLSEHLSGCCQGWRMRRPPWRSGRRFRTNSTCWSPMVRRMGFWPLGMLRGVRHPKGWFCCVFLPAVRYIVSWEEYCVFCLGYKALVCCDTDTEQIHQGLFKQQSLACQRWVPGFACRLERNHFRYWDSLFS